MTADLRTLTGVKAENLTPGSPEWLRVVSASKVPAILGLSRYQSRFSLWHEMAGTVTRTVEQTDDQFRGHLLEPVVLKWLGLQHPDSAITPTGTWRHPVHEWATASPDALVSRGTSVAVAEAKTDADGDGWGKAGTDEVPPSVRAQVVWQMYVTGARVAHVAVLLPFLEFREYRVDYNDIEAEFIVDECARFLESIRRGVVPPLDGSDSTYRTVRELHPDIDPADAEVDEDAAAEWLAARLASREATEAELLTRARVVDQMGNAHYAVCNGWRLGDRRAKNGGTPYFQPSRSLPSPDEVTTLKESA